MAVTVCVTYKHICFRTASTGWTGFTSPCGSACCSSRNSRRNSRRYYAAQDVEDSIHHLAHVGGARPTTSFCCRNE
jgi:hypothetical protein